MTDANRPHDDPHPPQHLPVMPHSGRVEQLRAEAAAAKGSGTPPSSAAAPEDAIASQPDAPQSSDATAPMPDASLLADPIGDIDRKLLEAKVIEALKQVYDPEIPVDIYELGLIYNIDVKPDKAVHVRMTLTAPACPVAGTLPGEVEKKIESVPEVKSATVELVWDPPWCREMMSEVAQLQLGLF